MCTLSNRPKVHLTFCIWLNRNVIKLLPLYKYQCWSILHERIHSHSDRIPSRLVRVCASADHQHTNASMCFLFIALPSSVHTQYFVSRNIYFISGLFGIRIAFSRIQQRAHTEKAENRTQEKTYMMQILWSFICFGHWPIPLLWTDENVIHNGTDAQNTLWETHTSTRLPKTIWYEQFHAEKEQQSMEITSFTELFGNCYYAARGYV